MAKPPLANAAGAGPKSPFYHRLEIVRAFQRFRVRPPQEIPPHDLHTSYLEALALVEDESQWEDNENRFVRLLFFLNMPPIIQEVTLTRLANASFRYFASPFGRSSLLKRSVLSMLVHFGLEAETNYLRICAAACDLALSDMERQSEHIKRENIEALCCEADDLCVVMWTLREFLLAPWAIHAERRQRQRIAHFVVFLILHFPPEDETPLQMEVVLGYLKDCIYCETLSDVIKDDLTVAVSKISADEAPRTHAKTIIKVFHRRVVDSPGTTLAKAENVLMRICVRMYKFPGDDTFTLTVRDTVSCILKTFPALTPAFRKALSQVWAKYGQYYTYPFYQEMNMIARS